MLLRKLTTRPVAQLLLALSAPASLPLVLSGLPPESRVISQLLLRYRSEPAIRRLLLSLSEQLLRGTLSHAEHPRVFVPHVKDVFIHLRLLQMALGLGLPMFPTFLHVLICLPLGECALRSNWRLLALLVARRELFVMVEGPKGIGYLTESQIESLTGRLGDLTLVARQLDGAVVLREEVESPLACRVVVELGLKIGDLVSLEGKLRLLEFDLLLTDYLLHLPRQVQLKYNYSCNKHTFHSNLWCWIFLAAR